MLHFEIANNYVLVTVYNLCLVIFIENGKTFIKESYLFTYLSNNSSKTSFITPL